MGVAYHSYCMIFVEGWIAARDLGYDDFNLPTIDDIMSNSEDEGINESGGEEHDEESQSSL